MTPDLPGPLQLPAGPHAVLLLHGLCSGPQELQFLARGLQRAGYTVRLPVLAGYSHGYPHGLPARESTQARWRAAALAEFDALAATHDSVAVGGLCIGAVLALHVAAARPGAVAACIGLSTTLYYDGWATPWTRRLLPLARVLPGARRILVRERAPYGVKDERMRAFIERQMKQSGNSDAGAAALSVHHLLEARELIAGLRPRLAAVDAPTLLVHAREDEAVSPRSALDAARELVAARVRCVLLNDSYHMLSIDREKHTVLAEMRAFLDQEQRGGRADLRALPLQPTARACA